MIEINQLRFLVSAARVAQARSLGATVTMYVASKSTVRWFLALSLST